MLVLSKVPLGTYIYYKLGPSFWLVSLVRFEAVWGDFNNTYSKRTLGKIAYIIIVTSAANQFFSSKVIHKLAYRYWNISLRNNMTSCCDWRTIQYSIALWHESICKWSPTVKECTNKFHRNLISYKTKKIQGFTHTHTTYIIYISAPSSTVRTHKTIWRSSIWCGWM